LLAEALAARDRAQTDVVRNEGAARSARLEAREAAEGAAARSRGARDAVASWRSRARGVRTSTTKARASGRGMTAAGAASSSETELLAVLDELQAHHRAAEKPTASGP
jgi:hypothetical protein